jgi:membrane protein insertase Oxa1/YidC/SpoIIIJ
MKELAANIRLFDSSLFGIVDLTKAAIGNGGVYFPAMIIVVASCVAQYFQSKQLMPTDKEAKTIRGLLKSAGEGKQPDREDMNAAIGRNMLFFAPGMVFIFTVNLPSALSLYWLTSGGMAIIQQARVLKKDEEELEGAASAKDMKTKETIKTEIIPPKKAKTTNKKKSNKRRKL